MKILYSAFECNPGIGSDAYVGWSWAKQMSKDNEVHVLTNAGNKEAIEKYLANHSDVLAIFHYVDLPKMIKRLLKGRSGYFASYVLWQREAYKVAKCLSKEIEFDVVHHVAIADFRVIGYLWKLKTPFVFGPVGGGQNTPAQLMDYVQKYRKKEDIRNFINNAAVSLPSYRRGIKKAAAVFVSNDETIDLLRRHIGSQVKLEQMCELGVDEAYLNARESLQHKGNKTVHILVSGRMMYRKGVELLLDALLQIESGVPYVVDLYGGGHQIEDVRQQIAKRQLESRVILHGKVPFDEMPEIYAKADIFALPSLRETTGTAVVEAMASKLPVVALNQNGVKYLVKNDAGMLADIGTKEDTIRNFANALKTLIESETMRLDMGNRGYTRLKEGYTWEKKAKDMTMLYQEILDRKRTQK